MLTVAPADYYDAWAARLIDDYHARNTRVVAALTLAQTLIPGRLLDVGCGIGWTSGDLAEMGHTVTGLDISPVLTDTATRLFGDRCEFVCADFTEGFEGEFDSITMIDVYEHFPARTRPRVHATIARLLSPRGRLLLTAPTAELQQTARERGIEMQPVDEDVTADDIDTLAADTGSVILWMQRLALSSCGDYWHVLMERRC